MAWEGVDVEEVVDQLGLEVAVDPVCLVALVHVEDFDPAQVPSNGQVCTNIWIMTTVLLFRL